MGDFNVYLSVSTHVLFSLRLPSPCLFSPSLSLSLTAHPQLSSGVGCAPLPASLWDQAERLQGLPWLEHRKGEVARFPQDEKGKHGGCYVAHWLLFKICTKRTNLEHRFFWGRFSKDLSSSSVWRGLRASMALLC